MATLADGARIVNNPLAAASHMPVLTAIIRFSYRKKVRI